MYRSHRTHNEPINPGLRLRAARRNCSHDSSAALSGFTIPNVVHLRHGVGCGRTAPATLDVYSTARTGLVTRDRDARFIPNRPLRCDRIAEMTLDGDRVQFREIDTWVTLTRYGARRGRICYIDVQPVQYKPNQNSAGAAPTVPRMFIDLRARSSTYGRTRARLTSCMGHRHLVTRSLK